MKYGREIVISRGKFIELSVLSNIGVAVVKFDAEDSKVNVLSQAAMAELDHVLNELGGCNCGSLGTRPIFGAIFCSGKEDSFIVGADINEIQQAQSLPAEEAFAGSQKGKAIFAKITALPFPTVAAINGRCLGGGTELALACDERVCADNKATVIGLPEVALGVLPGWGGTVAAPKTIGFMNALPLVLNPLKPFNAARAWATGLVSEAVPELEVFNRAVSLALGESPVKATRHFSYRFWRGVGDSAAVRYIATQAMKLVIRVQTRGKYPAPGRALAVMNAAFTLSTREARELESRTFAELCHTPECAECVRKFFERKKKKDA